jgi:hypothetical protein
MTYNDICWKLEHGEHNGKKQLRKQVSGRPCDG